MTLHVHRAERADRLAEALAEVLAVPPADPFAADVVAVPTRGVERWLAQRLAHRLGAGPGEDGVCARVEFPPPAELVARARGRAEDDPWRPERLVWPLLAVVDECAGEDWCAPLGTYLGLVGDASGTRAGRRFAAARHLARLFDAYGEHRPAMLRAWAAKEDEDGAGGEVPPDLRWQPELWRRLRDRVAVPGPGETLPEHCEVVARGGGDLPGRVSLFGPTRLATAHLEVLEALARTREVHLWLPHPSPALWDAVAGAGPVGSPRRAADPTADAAAHPLLRSLARDARELQLRLPAGATDVHHPAPGHPPTTLLERLQDDLRRDHAPVPTEIPPDESVVVHSCHGPDRQVEVLREAVLGLLADDPTLEPRDVVVMCPDVETFAPLITAAFGAGGSDGSDGTAGHPGHRLAVRLADRALTQVNPLLGVLGTVLDLADARLSASELLDLAESEPVRRRFRFDDDDLERLRTLVARAGVRWGLDREHRASYRLGGVAENTWERGLDRLLVGVAMSGDEQVWLDTALPLDEVDSRDADLVGRLAELVDRVGEVLHPMRGEQPLGTWLDALTLAVDALTATPPSEVWQLTQTRAVLAEVRGAGAGAPDPLLTLHDVRAVLADHLAGRPTRANFRTGTLTVATLLPMRSVPHRVVCLLGLDDQVFPRETATDGDDVLARDPCVGERDAAAEDRQLLLDAVLAATERLVVVHSGADERTNAPRPPAVPIGELLDTLDATATVGGRPAREHVVRHHPLQPFAPRNFSTRAGRPFSFDAAQLAGARALVAGRATPPRFLDGPLPAHPRDGAAPTDVDLADLVRFVEHPVRAFLRQRLSLVARGEEEEPDEALPVDPDGLEVYKIGKRLLADRLAGHDVSACMEAERRRGSLPPGALGVALLRRVGQQAEKIRLAAAPLWETPAHDLTVAAALDDGTTVVGTVPGVRGTTLASVSFARLAAKHRAAAWVQVLALAVAYPDQPWSATTIGKGGREEPTAAAVIPRIDPERARAALTDLVALRAEGLREPLPLFAKASERYVADRPRRTTRQAFDAARRSWSADWGDGRDPAHVLVWGRDRPLDDVAGAPTGAGPDAGGESTRFGELAVRLWRPLREAESGREEHYR
ncbi:exodeoxyribonuclease V subunit gamma [Actinomycetospora sp. TBRC 11914]|uniref:exodeoxyribonuclease V subunit gamma n=1 Tax=Actinomycetospora sp. TBRC 11914 TaxID=2729387 RepID=UPI00145F015F|nr:exodeoxyribonuclease V subunit gamma [Actinomycetospora sp. TBRC 11914]NMO91990.1 exodeoxyribonuclease V subunit gamma [Actinomycetospora sp. TBRC 11914]